MKRVMGFGLWVLGALALASCAGAPSYPDPQPGYGQILVHLNGVPKEGVTGPKTREIQGEYNRERISIEEGKAFERVNYKSIEDVVVICTGGSANMRPTEQVLEINDGGFVRSQLAARGMWRDDRVALLVKNLRPSDVTVYASPRERSEWAPEGIEWSGLGVIEVTVPAGGTAEMFLPSPITWDLSLDEDPDATCVVFSVVNNEIWCGASDSVAFFDRLAPAEYRIFVYPPRLPPRSTTVNVTAGKRETVTVDLTVNDLPKVRR